MQNFNVMQRVLIIFQKIKQNEGITLKELQEQIKNYLELIGETRIDFSGKTIKRDIGRIREIFGISVNYSPYKGYYIPEDEEADATPEIIETFQETFNIFNAINATTGLQQFIFPEHRPYKGTEHLYPLLKATQKKQIICLRYKSYYEETEIERTVYPYALKQVNNRWYLLGMEKGDNILKSFGLDRIVDFNILKQTFTPKPIDIKAAYHNCYGIFKDNNAETEEVVLSFNRTDGKYVKSQPIHHSQQEAEEESSAERYAVRLFLQPNDEFILGILSRGYSLKVHKPEWLKKQVYQIYLNGARANAPGQATK
ncbi:MAG: WYL domain-containing protein [Odoribacter sp.]|nr:WYL domain-containing protein [Odoribacter sp.]